MPYIDRTYIESKLENNYLEEVLSDGNSGVNESKLNGLIADAESEVNLKLSRRYVVPIVSANPLVKKITFDIFAFRLESSRQGIEVAEDYKILYRQAIKDLDSIADGTYSFEDGVANELPQPSTTGHISTNKTSSDKVFNKDLLASM